MPTLDELIKEKFLQGGDTNTNSTDLDTLIKQKFNDEVARKPEEGAEPPSALGSFARSVLRGVPSAAVAGTLGRLGMATSPVISPFGAIPLSLAGAGAGAYFTRKYQDPLLQKILPSEMYNKYTQSEQADVQTNPMASRLGDFASMIASGFAPNLGNVKQAGSSILKLAGRRSLPAPEVSNLVNVGGGAAIAPAMLAGQAAITGQSPTLGDYVQSSLGGALFNRNLVRGRNAPPPTITRPTIEPPPLPRQPLQLPLQTESGLAEANRPGNIELTPDQLLERANTRLQPKTDQERLLAEAKAREIPNYREVQSKRLIQAEPVILPKPTIQLPKELVPAPIQTEELQANFKQPNITPTAEEAAMYKTGLQRTGKIRPIIQPTIDELISQKLKEENAPQTSSIETGSPEQYKGTSPQLGEEGINRDITSKVEGEGNKTSSGNRVLSQAEKPITNFKTSKGSEYSIDQKGLSIRTKNSPGKGQGEVHSPMQVVYLTPEQAGKIQESGMSGDRIIITQKQGDNNFKQLKPIASDDLSQIQGLHISSVSQKGEHLSALPVSKKPEIGLHPFEIVYDKTGENKTYHLGNEITEVGSKIKEELPTSIQAALKRIKEKSGGSTLAGIPDPTILADLTRVGGYYVRKGVTKFTEWSAKMDEKFGPELRPQLAKVWDQVRGDKPEIGGKDLSLGYFKPQIQKVKEISPTGEYLGSKLDKFYFDKDKLGGIGENFAREASGYSKAERANVENYLQEQQDTGGKSKIALTSDEQQLLGEYKKLITSDTYLKSGIRDISKDPNYYPQKLTPDVVDILLNHPGSDQANKLKQDFLDYQMKGKDMTMEKAQARFRDLVQSYKSPEQVNRASQFGPLDKPEGYGIPLSWRERDIIKNITSYTSRAARRISYFNNIESDPLVRESLGIQTTPEGKPSPIGNKLPSGENVDVLTAHQHVAPIVKDIEGRFSPAQAHIASAQRLIRSGMLGTQTGIGNLIGSQVQGWQHMSPGQVPGALVAGWKNLNQNLKESTLAGVNRMNHSSLEFRSSEFADITQHLNDIANVSNKLQAKNLLERVSRANNWGQGKYLAMAELANGLKTGKSKFLDDFGPEDWRSKKSFSPEELNDVATRYVNSVQGTYDYRGLPEAYVNSPYSTILALSRWSGEKANNYMKYVVNPLVKEGNYKPFLMQTAGMVLGGSVVEKILETMGGRKSSAPNYQELKAGLEDKDVTSKDEIEALGYKMMSLATLAGSAGMLSNLGKSVMDVMYGNRPQSIGDPLWEATSRTGATLTHAVQAFQEGEPNLGINLITQLLKDNIQGARLVLNNFNDEFRGNVERGNKARDLRVYESIHGHPPSSDIGGITNPFMGRELKQFRNSTNVNDIVSQGSGLVNKTLAKDQSKPELLIQDLNKLRTQSRSVMPSMEGNTPEFVNYYNWILKTQGRAKASQLMNEYLMKEKGYDEIRKSLVPSVK